MRPEPGWSEEAADVADGFECGEALLVDDEVAERGVSGVYFGSKKAMRSKGREVSRSMEEGAEVDGGRCRS